MRLLPVARFRPSSAEGMFKTTHDAANREVVRAVIRAELNLVGIAMRAERKVIDKMVDGLKFHS
jgi:hypothetical protein